MGHVCPKGVQRAQLIMASGSDALLASTPSNFTFTKSLLPLNRLPVWGKHGRILLENLQDMYRTQKDDVWIPLATFGGACHDDGVLQKSSNHVLPQKSVSNYPAFLMFLHWKLQINQGHCLQYPRWFPHLSTWLGSTPPPVPPAYPPWHHAPRCFWLLRAVRT